MSQVSFNFSQKKFVITGASSGMGRQIALELAQSGAHVLGIARGEAALQELQKEAPQNISIAPCDVTNSTALEQVIASFVAKQGKLSGSVHAAGISGLTPLKVYDSALVKQIMDISFWAGIELIRLATKVKYAEKASSNVVFSSVSSYSGEKGMFAYSASKAAIRIATKSLSKELAPKKHRINSISPGWVTSNMSANLSEQLTEIQHMVDSHLLGVGRPEDVSGMVLFLLSDRARWITGTDFIVDGGFLA